jgi:hypothetical protein
MSTTEKNGEETPASEFSSLQSTLIGMHEILFAETRCIDLCLHRLKAMQEGKTSMPAGASPKVLNVVLTMIHMVGISAHSVLKLTEEISLQARDAYPIARSIIEMIINIAFIMAEGEPTAALADRHAQQKAFRDLKRTSSISGFTFTVGWIGKIDPEDEKRLSAMMSEFTTKSGREKRTWTDKSVEVRTDIVAKRFGHRILTTLHSATLMIYRHASEILHGTYFSALFFWGLTTPGTRPKTPDELRMILGHHQFTVLCGVIFANAALLECVAQYFGIIELNTAAGEFLARMETLPLIKAGLDEQMTPKPRR